MYLNYGVHWLLNFLVKGGTEDGFVLIRALEPTSGLEQMQERRKTSALKNLCSGPGKLTRALQMDRAHHGLDIFSDKNFRLHPPARSVTISTGPRIGITKAADLPWRFVLSGSRFLSAPEGPPAKSPSREG